MAISGDTAARPASATNKKQCNRCRYWLFDPKTADVNNPGWGFGSCRVRPPVLLETILAMQVERPRYGHQVELDLSVYDIVEASRHPVTISSAWCGRYEPVREGC